MKIPRVRRDGRCYVCKGERPFTPQKGVPYEAYLQDPFCSGACARKFYGTELKNVQVGPPGKDPSRHRGKGIRLRKRGPLTKYER